MLGQDQANQLGTPGGVLLAEGVGLQHHVRPGLGAGGRPVIGRRGELPALVPGLPQQVVDGTQAQVVAPGQGPGRQPPLVATEHGLSEVGGQGAGHGRTLLGDEGGGQATPTI
jgi:hypothetical protein